MLLIAVVAIAYRSYVATADRPGPVVLETAGEAADRNATSSAECCASRYRRFPRVVTTGYDFDFLKFGNLHRAILPVICASDDADRWWKD